MPFTTQYTLSASSSSNTSRVPSITSSTPSSNYEDAFGVLSSSYGFAASAPSVPSKASLSQPSSQRASCASTPSQSSSSSTCKNKNYEVALASLYSSYGFGGSAAPVVPIIQNATPTPACRSVNAPSDLKNIAQSPRNYEEALAQLSSSYGVASAVTVSRS